MNNMTSWNGVSSQPLRARKPRSYLMPDLFAEPDDAAIDLALAIVALCPHHQFFLLTEHAKAMADCFDMSGLAEDPDYPGADYRSRPGHLQERIRDEALMMCSPTHPVPSLFDYPFPNFVPGVLVTTQAEADDRVPKLLACPAARRWVHVVPGEAVDLRRFLAHSIMCERCPGPGMNGGEPCRCSRISKISVAGPVGPGATPVHSQWVRGLRDQAASAGVAFRFDVWGEWRPFATEESKTPWDDLPFEYAIVGISGKIVSSYRDDGDLAMARVGPSRSGRELDGVEHDWPAGAGSEVSHGE